MRPREICKDIYFLGAVDWERRLFDALIPLPDGTSYNAYLVKGQSKTVLIDSVDPSKSAMFLEQLSDVVVLDYVIVQHAEQDHSGSVPAVLAQYPQAIVLCSPKCKPMLEEHLEINPDRIRCVTDGELLDLGGKTLEFHYTPWVHWPETMSTYCPEEKIWFTCDFFGAHVAASGVFVEDEGQIYEAAKRYYAEIMMPFRAIIKKNIVKIESKEIRFIAPSHGQVYSRPQFIIDAYKDWISDTPKNETVIAFISMHDSTRIMVDYLVDALTMRDVKVVKFDLSVTDLGKLAIALVDAASIVLGTPTVHIGPHPNVMHATILANELRPKLRVASIIGSYGWATKAVEHLSQAIPNLNVELIPPVLCKGKPKGPVFEALDVLADQIVAKHKEYGCC